MSEENGNGCLTADDIWRQDDLKIIPCDVPEWGGRVYIRTLKGQEKNSWEEACATKRDGTPGRNMDNYQARLVVRVACDAKGERIFTDADGPRLGAKSGAAIDRIFDVAAAHNHLMQKDVEDMKKNLEGVETSSSGSGSPSSQDA